MPIKALIADDEVAARSRLRKLLVAHPAIEIAGEAHDGLATLEAIRELRPDVVFLDVQMPGLTGFEVVQALPPKEQPLIVFVTAYDQYALAAFDANAVAYLLKPVDEDRLASVVDRITRMVGSAGEASQDRERTNAVAHSQAKPLHHVLARQREGYLLVPIADVCFFRVEDGITKVKTMSALHSTNYAIGDLEDRLPNPPFFRAHRSIITSMDKIASISPLFKGALLLTMKDEQKSEIQVSERQAKIVRAMLHI